MKIPTTTIIEPMTFLKLTFSCSTRIAASVEKRGVADDIGTARDAGVSMKL